MRKIILIFSLVCLTILYENSYAQALSARHHLFNAAENIIRMIFAPFKGTFVTGPRNIREAYTYEVYEREDATKRGKLRYRLYGIWRAPGEEAKGIISGIAESVNYGAEALKELISIFWGD
jgi:hypothetical protein